MWGVKELLRIWVTIYHSLCIGGLFTFLQCMYGGTNRVQDCRQRNRNAPQVSTAYRTEDNCAELLHCLLIRIVECACSTDLGEMNSY